MFGAGGGPKPGVRFAVNPEPCRCATDKGQWDVQGGPGVYLPLDRTTGLENALAPVPAGLLTFRPALIP
jgi:hypothetical protein